MGRLIPLRFFRRPISEGEPIDLDNVHQKPLVPTHVKLHKELHTNAGE